MTMTQSFQFDGIYTPLVTPFKSDFSIDQDALADLIEHLITCGVNGIISGGSTGENYTQTLDERLAVAKFTRARIGRRVPFIVGTGSMLAQESIALAQGARAMGADAILVASPPYALPTAQENALNALRIDRAADLPIMLYNYPGRMGVSMDKAFLDRIGESHNVCAIKESSGDIARIHLLANDYPQIQMSCGMDDQALEFFAWGARSWVCGGSNFLPAEHIALYRACAQQGNFTRGRAIMSALLPLMNLLEQGGHFVQCIKHGVSLNGIAVGPVRPPLGELDQAQKHALEQVLQVLQPRIAQLSQPPTEE